MRHHAVVVLVLATLAVELSTVAPASEAPLRLGLEPVTTASATPLGLRLESVTPASAAPLALRLESVTTAAGGTPVTMHFTALCSPAAGSHYTLRVTLAQRTGRSVTVGRAETTEACSGRPQSLLLRAVPDAPGAAFHPGRMSVTSCLRVRTLRPSGAGRVAPGSDEQPCTGDPNTALVQVTEP